MTTVNERLKWWRTKEIYLGDNVNVSVVNRITYDSNGNPVKSTTCVVDITIYTRAGHNAIERSERWIVPDAMSTDYLDKQAYLRRYTVSNRIVRFEPLYRRTFWWW